MKKRFFNFVKTGLIVFLTVFVLQACDNGDSPKEHIHSFSLWGNSTATCDEAGVETRVCSEDGTIEERPAVKLGHKYEIEASTFVEWDCETDGYKKEICAHDGTHVIITEKPAGHDYKYIVTTPKDCTTYGEETEICQHDNTHTRDTRPIEGGYGAHTFDGAYYHDNDKDGHYQICSVDGEARSDKQAHRFNTRIVMNDPTYEDAGDGMETCDDCGYSQSYTIDQLKIENYITYLSENLPAGFEVLGTLNMTLTGSAANNVAGGYRKILSDQFIVLYNRFASGGNEFRESVKYALGIGSSALFNGDLAEKTSMFIKDTNGLSKLISTIGEASGDPTRFEEVLKLYQDAHYVRTYSQTHDNVAAIRQSVEERLQDYNISATEWATVKGSIIDETTRLMFEFLPDLKKNELINDVSEWCGLIQQFQDFAKCGAFIDRQYEVNKTVINTVPEKLRHMLSPREAIQRENGLVV